MHNILHIIIYLFIFIYYLLIYLFNVKITSSVDIEYFIVHSYLIIFYI